jgi:hypothetical protein
MGQILVRVRRYCSGARPVAAGLAVLLHLLYFADALLG